MGAVTRKNKRREDLLWIAAAFILLGVVSVYRQLGMRFFPADAVRPVVVYVVYLLLLVVWGRSIRHRVTQRNMQVFLLVEYSLMLIGITVRFIQDALLPYLTDAIFLYNETSMIRVSGYTLIIPMTLLPLFGLYASLGLGKTEEYRFDKKWYFLLIPVGFLILLSMTNESHHLVFSPLLDSESGLFYHPEVGLYIIVVWAFSLLLVRISLIYRRSRALKEYPRLKTLPFLIAIFMILFNIPYILASYVVTIELIEYAVSLFFLEILVWESCIFVGMVPVNTQYEEVFDRSSAAIQIVDNTGNSFLKSACAPELSTEMFERLKRQNTVRIPGGQELNLRSIRGGYAIWKNDMSRTHAVIDELRQSSEKLEYEGELISQELKLQWDTAAVRGQNRLYNQLTQEVGDQLILLSKLLKKLEWTQDKTALLRKICLIGTYIKRRCNLRLIELSDGAIPHKELELSYHELIGCLRQMGVEAEACWIDATVLAPEFAIFTLDFFEFLLEYERFDLNAIGIKLETDTAFSVRVLRDGALPADAPIEDIQRINRDNYDIDCQRFEDGYQISVCMGGH